MKRESRFVTYCLQGLNGMYLRSQGVFVASRRLIDGRLVNVRDRDSEFKFTMNALMGLHRARAAGSEVFLDIESIFHRLAEKVSEQAGSPENIAATVWAGSSIGTEVPKEALTLFEAVVDRAACRPFLSGQGLAWTIAASIYIGEGYIDKALELAKCAVERYIHPCSSLVRHTPSGLRRDWASFAASCYMAYAFLLLGRKTANEEAKQVGLKIARALAGLQGPQGQWAWFYHVPSGRVADYYPVYSVHQHAMAPFFLLEAFDQGYYEFKEPLLRGFRWVFGENELRLGMVDNTHHVIWRSVTRREHFAKLGRLARAIGVTYAGLSSGIEVHDMLCINKECRSYELGWALWAFAGRRGFDEMLNNPVFA